MWLPLYYEKYFLLAFILVRNVSSQHLALLLAHQQHLNWCIMTRGLFACLFILLWEVFAFNTFT